MKLAGAQAVRFCKKPDPGCWAFLLFGGDDGVVSDAAIALRVALSQSGSETENITLDEDDIRREPALLFDALEARSLLGNDRIIRVRTSGDKIAALLLEAIALGDESRNRFDAKMIITSGALQKRSKLRTHIETAKHAMAMHFYEDETGDVADIARKKLAMHRVEIEEDALALLVSELPGHRGMANHEIEKLALYGHDLGRAVSVNDVRALSTTDIDHALHELIDATLGGHVGAAHSGLDRLMVAGNSPISVLRALQREVTRLLQAHALMGSGGEIGMKLRPPVFKNAWPAFRQKLGIWSPKRLTRVLERVYDAEEMIKSAGPTGDAILQRLIADLSHAAEQAR